MKVYFTKSIVLIITTILFYSFYVSIKINTDLMSWSLIIMIPCFIIYQLLFSRKSQQFGKPIAIVILLFLFINLIISRDIIYKERNNLILNNMITTPCNGSPNCLGEINNNFKANKLKIVSNKYVGNGSFKIRYVDSNKNLIRDSLLTTDCNCKIK